ncbi:MAG: hypothetical protein FJ244_05680 [Nitrospira sp.]|nr:hypothetical protein [Nitrospira sp.]
MLAGALHQIELAVRQAGGRTLPGQLHTLLERQFSVQFVGKAFGVFKLEGLLIDISIPSRISTDHGTLPGLLRQVAPEMDIDEALARRDFTPSPGPV